MPTRADGLLDLVLARLGSGRQAAAPAGLCQPAERDIYDCYVTCFWPVQVAGPCELFTRLGQQLRGTAAKDWRSLDIIFP